MLFGRHWIPAPTSPMLLADSRTVTLCPARRIEIAAPRPPRPAPIIITYGVLGLEVCKLYGVGGGLH